MVVVAGRFRLWMVEMRRFWLFWISLGVCIWLLFLSGCRRLVSTRIKELVRETHGGRSC